MRQAVIPRHEIMQCREICGATAICLISGVLGRHCVRTICMEEALP